MLCNRRSHGNERPMQQLESSLYSLQVEKSPRSNEDPAQPKKFKLLKINNRARCKNWKSNSEPKVSEREGSDRRSKIGLCRAPGHENWGFNPICVRKLLKDFKEGNDRLVL